jgi:hypothetical protein
VSNVPPPECVTTAGVMAAGNVVGMPITDDLARARRAEQQFFTKLRIELFAVDPSARFRSWIDRGELQSPSGEYAGHGYRINFAVRNTSSQQVRSVIDAQPTSFEGLEIWSHDWHDEPATLE